MMWLKISLLDLFAPFLLRPIYAYGVPERPESAKSQKYNSHWVRTELDTDALASIDAGMQSVLDAAHTLRETGRQLDEAALLAIAERTNAPLDFVRVVLSSHPENAKASPIERLKTSFISLEPNARRLVASAASGTLVGMLEGLRGLSDSSAKTAFSNSGGFIGILSVVAITLGIYNVCLSRDSRTATLAGAIFSGLAYAMFVAMRMVLGLSAASPAPFLWLSLAGAFGGFVVHRLVGKYHRQLGIKDPVSERQELLRQLVEIQDKLRSGEQGVAFLSVDIVGSTKLKQSADPLSVEFTFNEYHRYADSIARKHLGRVHSTAGDGITMAFDHPRNAYQAARNLIAGLIELNTFRNKIGKPIEVRCGIHAGTVTAPDAGDIRSLNFASVIDIAAHLQKEAPVGGIAISEYAAAHVPGGVDAIGTERLEVSGVSAVIWAAKSIAAGMPHSAPPPPPRSQ